MVGLIWYVPKPSNLSPWWCFGRGPASTFLFRTVRSTRTPVAGRLYGSVGANPAAMTLSKSGSLTHRRHIVNAVEVSPNTAKSRRTRAVITPRVLPAVNLSETCVGETGSIASEYPGRPSRAALSCPSDITCSTLVSTQPGEDTESVTVASTVPLGSTRSLRGRK